MMLLSDSCAFSNSPYPDVEICFLLLSPKMGKSQAAILNDMKMVSASMQKERRDVPQSGSKYSRSTLSILPFLIYFGFT
jgi:hypothetical protein